MIKPIQGDMLKKVNNRWAYPADAFVVPVNCYGKMGAGFAQQFSRTFPRGSLEYMQACWEHQVEIGKMFVFDRIVEAEIAPLPRYLIFFPTKRHWNTKSSIDYVKCGLENLRLWVDSEDIQSISIPALGCGLGKLDWQEVKPMIEREFDDYRGTVYLFEPGAR